MATARFDSLQPSSGSGFTSATERSQFNALFQGDISPLRVTAQATPDITVAVAPSLIESYYEQVWAGVDTPLNFAGGNSPAVSAPSVNPRIDLLTIDSAGTLAWTSGAEAGIPTAPDCPSGKIPLAYVYCIVGMTTIVEYGNKDANPTQGYIYRDVRSIFNLMSSVSGDVIGPGSSTDGNIVLFDGAGGKTLKDGGHALTEYVAIPAGSARGDILIRGASAWTRLAYGTSGYFLKTLGSAADPAWAALGSILIPGSSAQGDILYFNGTVWTRLPAGTSGQFLKTLGAGANPVFATVGISSFTYVAGDGLLISLDTSHDATSQSYTKVKEVKLGGSGTIRVEFDLIGIASRIISGRIYRNGVAVGTEQSTASLTYVTKSEDISGWSVNDLLQLYVKNSAANNYGTVRNLRLYINGVTEVILN